METNLLTRKEKAEELKITIRTLDRWVKSGKITPIKIKDNSRTYFLPSIVDEPN